MHIKIISTMRKLFIVLTILSYPVLFTYGQLSEGGVPPGFKLQDMKSIKKIDGINLRIYGINKLLKEEQQEGTPLSYSIYKDVNIDIKDKGTVTETAEGKIWQFRIESENARSLGIIFSQYHLPPGAKLFIYNKDQNKIYGAFTAKNNKEKGHLAIAEFPGNEMIIEYYEPLVVDFPGTIIIGKIGQAYRDIFGNVIDIENDHVFDVNCAYGDHVQLVKHSVAKMSFEENGFGYLCTGNLINNVNSDGTPYFLTARHCISSNPPAQTLITYFNYEKDDCGGSILPEQTLSGSTFQSAFLDTDFSLLLLDDAPPKEYKPYYAGWNVESDSVVNSGSGVHHPVGFPKEVAIEFNPIINYPYETEWENNEVTPANTHWLMSFDIGNTRNGSSGSALLDENNRIIGQLHGGGDEYKLYGKLSKSWNSAVFTAQRLQPFLDPDFSGILVMDGYAPADNFVDAHPYTDFQDVCTGEPVELKDGSTFDPSSWNWTITPSTYTFLNGTDANSQNPVVSFDEDNSYTISLEVSKTGSSDEQIRTDYITASSTLDPFIVSPAEWEFKYEDIPDDMILYGLGAESYSWEVTKGYDYILIDSSTLSKDTLMFSRNDAAVLDSNHVIVIELTGYHGACSTAVYDSITIWYPFNDHIENAHMLSLGENGPFHNYRATTQENEPNPPQGDCNTQTTWCGCEVSDTILEVSVWFTFLGPASGVIGINAPGFDNQIAIYEADDYTDILSGNPSSYTILAANDDYFDEPNDYSALILPIEVNPEQLYWLQVDGSACGAMGDFTIELYDDYSLGTEDIVADETLTPFSLYPVPASDYLNITSNTFTGDFVVKIHSVDGRDILQKSFKNQSPGITNRIDLPGGLNNGLYVVSVTSGDLNYHQMVRVAGGE